MIPLNLDTHVVVWLYYGLIEKLSTRARQEIEAQQLQICPIVLLELQYLREIKKISDSPDRIAKTLEQDLGLSCLNQDLHTVITYALPESWTRDPFDRIIVACARSQGAMLLSCDRKISENYDRAIW